jgi:hypothetical protein
MATLVSTGSRLDDRGSIPGSGNDGIFFSSPPRPDRLFSQPASYPMGTASSFSGEKRPGREADY